MKTIYKMLRKNENGATAVYVAVVIVVLLMFAALAVDVNHLYAVRNELHNAADGGSLAGALVLINDDATINVQGALDEAQRIATSNSTGNQPIVEITVETGHWSFTNKTFTANPRTTQTEWQERSFSELDTDTEFINAVRVQTDRSDTPSFFAKILGFDQFFVSNDAVAWRGFAGSLFPSEIDQPIAICKEAITNGEGSYSCNMGRMLNSGGDSATHNTGAWTNFSQPCENATPVEMRPLICEDGNTNAVNFGQGIGAIGGVTDNIFRDLADCWEAATGKTDWWSLMLPVVLCPGNNVSTCPTLVGAVNVNVVWIQRDNDTDYSEVPREMYDPNSDNDLWECGLNDDGSEQDGLTCWHEFVDNFNLANVDGPPVSDEDYEEMWQKKAIYFLPDCTEHPPRGNSGGENFGIFAKYPKIVE